MDVHETPARRLLAALRTIAGERGASIAVAPRRPLLRASRRSFVTEPATEMLRWRRRRSAPAGRGPTGCPRVALEIETDAAHRVRLHYLSSLDSCRTHADVDAGLRHGREAIDTARRGGVESGLEQYLEAWARHAYGHALVGQRRIPEAVAQCQLALRRLEAAPAHPEVPPAEVLAVRWYLLDDLARAASASGEPVCAAHWRCQRQILATDLPASRWPAMSWPLPDVPRAAPQAARRG